MTCTFFTPKANWKHAVLHTWAPNRHAWSLFAAWKRGNFLLSRCLLHNIRQEISLPSRKNTRQPQTYIRRDSPKRFKSSTCKVFQFQPKDRFHKTQKWNYLWIFGSTQNKRTVLCMATESEDTKMFICSQCVSLPISSLELSPGDIPTTWNSQHSSQFLAIGLTEHT